MNIFILSDSRDPIQHFIESAKCHIDKHVVKMIAESTQMLVTALCTESFISQPSNLFLRSNSIANHPCKPLSPSMRKHPCTLWTCADIQHFHYLVRLANELVYEHQERYPLSPTHAYGRWLAELSLLLYSQGPVFIMPQNFAIAVKDFAARSTSTPHAEAVAIYREYYVTDKKRIASWKKRQMPDWFAKLASQCTSTQQKPTS